jgi:hypothetical protein
VPSGEKATANEAEASFAETPTAPPAAFAVSPAPAPAVAADAVGAGPLSAEAAGVQAKRQGRVRGAATPAAASAAAPPEGEYPADQAFLRLAAARPHSAEEWRQLAAEWDGFAASHPSDSRADDARVRAVEATREAWRASGEPGDEAAFRAAARAYLERADALQRERLRRLLEGTPRP